MKRNVSTLLKRIGRPYHYANRDKTYQGCFYPVQFLYPDLPRFEMPDKNLQKSCDFALRQIKKYCEPISPADIYAGDIIVTNFRGVLHIAVYWEFGKIIHVFEGHTLQIGRLKMFKDFQSYRVK